MESGIREILLVESGILEILLLESGIRKIFGRWNLESGKFELWDPDSRALKSGIQVKESEVPVTIGLRIPSFNDKESSTWNSKSTAWNPESKTVLDYPKHGTIVKTAMLFLEMINLRKIKKSLK